MPVFVLNDESVVTSHGFVVLNAGGKFDRFRENPVMLNAHNNSDVIGRWLNLTVSGSKLQADSEFDMEDPEAAKISGKVDREFLKGASMGIIINDAEMRNLAGLGYLPVVTDWELLEASIVSVPSNKSALKLYASDGKTVLDAGDIKLSVDSLINQKQNMEKITLSVEAAKVLGLGKEPEISDLNAAIMELSAKLASANQAKADAEKAKTDAEKVLNDHKVSLANALVDQAVAAGKITADKKESFVKLATSDFEQAKGILDSLPAKETFSNKTKTGDKSAPDREGWNYMQWLKEAPKELAAMEINEPERFAALKAAYKK